VAKRLARKGEIKVQDTSSRSKRIVLAALLGGVAGGVVVAVATKALPKMMSRMMSGMMQKMVAQGEGDGCSPPDM